MPRTPNRRVTFAVTDQPRRQTDYELRIHQLFRALDYQAKKQNKNLQKHDIQPKPNRILKSLSEAFSVRQSPNRRNAFRKSSLSAHSASSTGRTSRRSLRAQHRTTPLFVQRLAEKYRTDHSIYGLETSSHSTDMLHKATSAPLSLMASVNASARKQKQRLKREDSFNLNDTKRFLKNLRSVPKVTMAFAGKNRIQTETKKLIDYSVYIPVLSFPQRAVMQKFNASRNDPEYLAGIGGGDSALIKPTGDSALDHVDSALISQLLAIVRKNHRMQEDRKWNVIERTRAQQRLQQKMALREYNLQRMRQEVDNLTSDMVAALHRSEQQAKALDIQLRLNDERTVQAIHTANSERDLRQKAEQELSKAANENERIRCADIRMEENILLIDRFMNVVLSVFPDLETDIVKANEPTIPKHDTRDLKVAEIAQRLDAQHEKSKAVCYEVSALKKESRSLQRRMKKEAIRAAEAHRKLFAECERLEEEIEYLKDEIDNIQTDNAKFETGTFRKDELHKPLSLLRQHIFRTYRRNFDAPEENYGKMVEKMHVAARKVIAKFSRIPLTVVQKCFRAVDRDRSMEAVIVHDAARRAENDIRMQRFYYKSLDPPEIIWGRPMRTSNDDDFPVQLIERGNDEADDYEANGVRKTSVDIDRTDDWLQYQIHQMTDSEFELFFKSSGTIPASEEQRETEEPAAVGLTLSDEPTNTAEITRESRESSGGNFITSVTFRIRPEKTSLDLDLSDNLDLSVVKSNEEANLTKAPSYPELTAEEREKDEKAKEFYSHFEKMMAELFQRVGSDIKGGSAESKAGGASDTSNQAASEPATASDSDNQARKPRRKSRASNG